jgi:6-phosphogluconolactonase
VFVSVPSFDLILLGLGADGHTASLFPHSPALSEATRWVAAQYVEKLGADRITLTVPIINAARNILFLVAGADKASAARDVLRGEHRPGALPAQLIKPGDGKLVWLLDEDAGRELAIGK